MKPVYFPHTFLPASATDALRNLFPCAVVYQPTAGRVPEEMQPFVENGFLEVVGPAAGDADDIDRLIREFEEWGRRHHSGSGLEAALRHASAFGESHGADDSLYTIAAQLKRGMSSELATKTTDIILAARVFLQLAQTADQQRHQMAVELTRYESSRAHLFDALKGGGDPAAGEFESPAAAARPGHDADDRVELRLAAWARLFLNHSYPSPVFVTSSTVLIRHLVEILEGCQPVCIQDLAATMGESSRDGQLSPEGILLLLEDLAAGRIDLPEQRRIGPPAPDADRPVEPACVYVWRDVSPFVFFSRLFPDAIPMGDQPLAPVAWRHTIVIHLRGFTKTTSRLDTSIQLVY